MPLKSKAQHRFLRAAEAEGKVPAGTASRWWHDTPKKMRKRLPDRVVSPHEKSAFYEDGVKVALEKLAVGSRQARRINSALSRMSPATGAGPLEGIDRAGAVANINYGPGWQELGRASGAGAVPREQLSDIFSLEKGLLATPTMSLYANTDVEMMSPANRRKAYQNLQGTGLAANFKLDPASNVPADVQRGKFLQRAALKRFTYEPDRITKIRAALPPSARPVLVPEEPQSTGISLVKRPPMMGPADSPHTRLWRGSERTLRPAYAKDATWTSGHFDVAQRYAERLGDRVTGYRSDGITTGHFTPHMQTDTRRFSAAEAAARRSANPDHQFFERVVDSQDLDPSRIESQYVRGTEGLYHKRGANFFPTQSAVPYGYPQYKAQPWYTKIFNAAGRLARRILRR